MTSMFLDRILSVALAGRSRMIMRSMTPLALLSFSRYFPAALMLSPISLRPGRTLSLSEISKGKIREILVAAPRADVVV
jgi:hypothetical protein